MAKVPPPNAAPVPPSLPVKPPVPTKAPASLVKAPAGKPPAAPARVAKTFAIADWSSDNLGLKIVAYSKSGGGKSTLAAQIKGAVFIGLDDGGSKIGVNPVTGEKIRHVPNIATYEDVRDALHQRSLWQPGMTAVIDTITKLEELTEPYLFANYKLKGNQTATSMRAYGWDGPAHQLDALRLILTDADSLVHLGVNVLVLAQLAQVRVANAEGMDYLEDGPKLQHNNQYSSRTELCEWADHVLRIGYANVTVEKDTEKAKTGKITAGDETRAVFSGGAPHFIAKSRPVNGSRIPAVISFNSPEDNSLWQFLLEGAAAA